MLTKRATSPPGLRATSSTSPACATIVFVQVTSNVCGVAPYPFDSFAFRLVYNAAGASLRSHNLAPSGDLLCVGSARATGEAVI
jgi:hypothetical protein